MERDLYDYLEKRFGPDPIEPDPDSMPGGHDDY